MLIRSQQVRRVFALEEEHRVVISLHELAKRKLMSGFQPRPRMMQAAKSTTIGSPFDARHHISRASEVAMGHSTAVYLT